MARHERAVGAWVSAVAAAAALAGCAIALPEAPHAKPAAKPAEAKVPPAQAELIGISRAAVIACAGEPWRAGTHEGLEYLIYMSGEPPRAPDVQAPQNSGAPAAAVATRPRYCRVTFVMKDGVVEKLQLAGYATGPLVDSKECAAITAPCLKK